MRVYNLPFDKLTVSSRSIHATSSDCRRQDRSTVDVVQNNTTAILLYKHYFVKRAEIRRDKYSE